MNVQAINTYNNRPSFRNKMSYRDALTYVVRNTPIDKNVLAEKIGVENGSSLSGISGFIGDVYKDKYHITKDGIEYYKNCYGSMTYYWHRVTGFICKFINRITE